jgi:hypothetical protein
MRTASSADPESTPVPESFPRRSVMRGAAWAVPSVVAAVAAPAMAASPACPDISDPTQWERMGSPYYSGGANGGSPAVYMGGLHQGDDSISPNQEAWGYGETTMPVIAGQTYTFRFGIGTTHMPRDEINYGQHLFFNVNGERLGLFFSRPLANRIQITATLPEYQYHEFTWTAPTTGTVPVRFEFVLPPRPAELPHGGDDVRVTFPTVTTTGC